MHVDGFRFDLASILGRDEFGNILANPPLIERIEQDPILRNTQKSLPKHGMQREHIR